MTKRQNLAALLAAGIVTVLVVAGLSTAASTAGPTNQSPPTISGTAQEGQKLTSSTGTWKGSGKLSYDYQWRRCDGNGGSCSNITGATDKTYTLKKVDVDNTLRVRVTATDSTGSTSASSVPTAVVTAAPAPPPKTSNGCPTSGSGTLDVKDVSLPARLSIDGQQVSPTTVGRSTQDLIGQVPRLGVQRTLDLRCARLCGGRSVRAVLRAARGDDRERRMGDADDAPEPVLPGVGASAAARGLRPGTQAGRGRAGRHLDRAGSSRSRSHL